MFDGTTCDHPRPGHVLFLDDPYCWYSNRDVRKYLEDPAYDVRMDPCQMCAVDESSMHVDPTN